MGKALLINAQISNSYEPIKLEDFSKYMDLSSFTPVIVDPEKNQENNQKNEP
jgi:hypothetical protein